ncbi:zinc finger and SCAN domain-containing protein 31-like [Clinocottus analis]|uniref:zinc finger and SCAN domain-containing protein 31-like n=1 Tax=Clinocottus analis TaxID=304258 RepID=UPI0035C10C23
MCKVQMLRALVKQRLTAAAQEIFGLFERTIAEYEEELSASRDENERQRRLLDAVFNPEVRVHRADVQQLFAVKDALQQQVWSSSLDQEDPEPLHIKEEPPHIKEDQEDPEPPHIKEDQEDPEPPHIKEDPEPPHIKVDQEDLEPLHIKEDLEEPEPPHIKVDQEELWTSQEGKKLQELEEAGIKFSFTSFTVKSEDDEDEAQSSQLHQTRNREAEPPASSSTEHMETESDGGDCGEPDRNSGPHKHLQISSRDEASQRDDERKKIREPQSGLNSLNNSVVSVSESRCSAGEKPFRCWVWKKSFRVRQALKSHMRTHTGEKPFSCSVCEKRFIWKGNLKRHFGTPGNASAAAAT